MRQAETVPDRPARGIWRILLGVMVVLAVVVVGIVANIGLITDLAFGNTIQDATRALTEAEERLNTNPDDESAHLARANAYIVLGHLEGARLEFENRSENSSIEWDDIGRTLDELQLKTDQIRALVHEAETTDWPSDNYPPIYNLLDDIAERFTGIPRSRALFLKGYLLLREGRKSEARLIFDEELDDYEILRDYVRYNFARSLAVTDMEDDALDEFNNFIEEFPSSRLAPLAHLERINIFRDLARTDDALEECARAMDAYPASSFAPKTLRKWAEIYEEDIHDSVSGAAIRMNILRDFPDADETTESTNMFFGGIYSPDMLTESDRLIVAYSAIGSHTDEAFDILSELADSEALTDENRAQACHGAARCEYMRWRYTNAISWAERARDFAPGTGWADRAGIRAGHSYWHLDRHTLAFETYWDVARGHGPIGALAGEILWQKAYGMRDLETTEEACRFIADEYPGSDEAPAALAMLTYLACRDGQYQSARTYAERCISGFPDNESTTEARFWYARALAGLNRDEDAGNEYISLSRYAPWDFWGIRAGEISGIRDLAAVSVDPFEYDPEQFSVFDGRLAVAWELYEAGTLELAESEFRLAIDEGLPGARSGLALVYGEQGRIRPGVLEIRTSAALGDQAFMTHSQQGRLLDTLYPRPFELEVRDAALAHNVPPSWLWGAMRQESTFNPDARSSVGARGLIQIMPETGRFIADRRGADTFDPDVLWDPATNLDYSAWYFSYLRSIVGDSVMHILAAYNGGPGRLGRYRDELPTRDIDIFISAIPNEEMRHFARWVYGNVRMYDKVLDSSDFQVVPF